jgi:multiple sugar transport system ATP-binding protein
LARKPKALSGGQRQRVAVGRAIVRKPKAFLFDEPLSNLDAKMRVQMRTEISRLHHQLSSTMIYVTHDQVEAMTMGDRIVVMKDGEFQQVAPPLELYNNPANQFVAGFIGSPPMNFFNGRVALREGVLWFVEGAFDVRIDAPLAVEHGQEIVFGIRPEDVSDRRYADTFSSEQGTTARVEVVEQMGAEVLVYLNTGSHSFISRMGSRAECAVDSSVDVIFNMERARYFNKETGNRIG